MHVNPRLIATRILVELLQKKASLGTLLPRCFKAIPDRSQKSFVQELCFGVSRWYYQLKFLEQKLLQKPMKPKDLDIEVLILLGLYQIIYVNKPLHATVSETVDVVKTLQKKWAVGFVNAILRNFLRNKEQLMGQLNKDLSAKYAHPVWLVKKLQAEWPNDWQLLLEQNNQHPMMSLRINPRKISREKYCGGLKELDVAYDLPEVCDSCVILKNGCAVNDIPEFQEGLVSVQDCGAQLAAELLDLKPKQIVLDACAAPGGKTTHILELQPDLEELIAVDLTQERLAYISENLLRLKQKAELVAADICKVKNWWNGKQFDRILVDAPCSATGVIRRHPDIKILRRESDIKSLAETQLEILEALWPLLTPNGKLVYVTCSVLPEENQEVIKTFLAKTADAKEEMIQASWGRTVEYGKQLLPNNETDGFYFACLQKAE